MIMLQTLGAGELARLMSLDRGNEPDLSWLLFGPASEVFVEGLTEPPPNLLAAE